MFAGPHLNSMAPKLRVPATGREEARAAAEPSGSRSLLSSICWASAGQLAAAAGGLVGIRLVTQVGAPAVFGEASLTLAGLVLIRSVFLNPITSFQLRYAVEHQDVRSRRAFEYYCTANARRSLAWILTLLVLGVGFWSILTGRFRGALLLAAGLYSVADCIRTLRVTMLNADGRQLAYAGWSALEAWLVPTFGAVALAWLGTSEAYIAAVAIGTILPVVVFQRARTSGRSTPRAEPADMARLDLLFGSYARPFGGIALLNWIGSTADRFIVGTIGGLHEAGVYAATFSIASRPMLLLSSALTVAGRPILFEAESKGDRAASRRILLVWILVVSAVSTLVVTAFALGGPWIGSKVLGHRYRGEAAGLFAWLAAAHALLALSQALENRTFALRRSRAVFLAHIASVASSGALCVGLVWTCGARGAAFAKCAGYSVYLLALLGSGTRLRRRRTLDSAAAPAIRPPFTGGGPHA